MAETPIGFPSLERLSKHTANQAWFVYLSFIFFNDTLIFAGHWEGNFVPLAVNQLTNKVFSLPNVLCVPSITHIGAKNQQGSGEENHSRR